MSTSTSGRGCRCAGPGSRAIVSRHATSEGLMVYARCECGFLHLTRLRYGAADELLAASERPGLHLMHARGGTDG